MERIMNEKIILILFLVFTSCNSDDCKVDEYVSNQVEKRFEIIKNFEKGKPVGVYNYLDAISFFTKFSGHEPKLELGGAIGYGPDTLNYKKDMAKWRLWYAENKCTLNKKSIDSIISAIKE